MSDLIVAQFDIAPFLGQIKQAAALTERDTEELIRREATLFVYNPNPSVPGVINITPPLGDGTKGKAGLVAGKEKIDRDLFGIFAPRVLTGTRTIDHLFGDKSPDVGRQPPYVVPTKELNPDVLGIYNQRNSRRKQGRALSRGRKQPWYVDKGKFEALRQNLHKRVGWTCAAWYVSAVAAGLDPRGVPAWIKQHTGASGTASITISATGFAIVLTSSTQWNASLRMDEKAAAVIGYRERALQRSLPYAVRAILKKANLNAA